MTLTLNLPDDLAARLASSLPEAERYQFAFTAIEEALSELQHAAEDRLELELLVDYDDERDSAQYRAAVEGGLDDVDAGRDLVSFEEVQRRLAAGGSLHRA